VWVPYKIEFLGTENERRARLQLGGVGALFAKEGLLWSVDVFSELRICILVKMVEN